MIKERDSLSHKAHFLSEISAVSIFSMTQTYHPLGSQGLDRGYLLVRCICEA